MTVFRPILTNALNDDRAALRLAGGLCRFTTVEVMERGRKPVAIPAADVPDEVRMRLCAPRAAMPGLAPDRPAIMGILNATPDSFSDGGQFLDPEAALAQIRAMVQAGADILDIGGESTRPGAQEVDSATEIGRTTPLIEAFRATGGTVPVSIDTRKASVARAAIGAGADIVNDVAALRFDPDLAGVVASSGVPVCLMHAQGDPETMQDDPTYDNVVLDVYDFLEERVNAALAAGIARDRIIVDPGIGFGKTVAHNLSLIRNLSAFHGLGCPILLGASRKRFIGTIGGTDGADQRMPGSLAVALAGAAQGVQVLRVHDVDETRQALALWQAIFAKDDKE